MLFGIFQGIFIRVIPNSSSIYYLQVLLIFQNNSNLCSKSWSELRDVNAWKNALPESMTKAEVLVRARVEDPEVQAERAEITKNKTVQELSQINSLADFPIPKTIETLINKEKLMKLEKSRYCKQKYDF